MIVNQVVGRSFKGALAYAFTKEDSEFAFSNLANTPTDGINRMASEFIAVASQRPNLSRSVAHIQFSPNPEDEISDEKFREAIEFWIEEMGYENSLYAVAFHNDTDIRHAHLVTSRVDLNGDVVSDANNYARNLKVSRELEKRFNLNVTEPSIDAEKPTPKWQLDKTLPPADYIKESIKAVGASAPSMNDFIDSLQALGVDTNLKLSSKQGIAQGVSFGFENYSVAGGKIGYSLKKLEKEFGIKYERNNERNSAVFSERISEPEAAKSAAAERIQARAEERNEVSTEPRPPGIRSIIQRVANKIDAIRTRLESLRRDDRELPRVADQLDANREIFREICKVLESRNSLDMTLKKSFFGELRENMNENRDLDMKLDK